MNEFTDYQPPSWDAWFMKQVYLTAERSKDPRTKIGAVLVRNKNVISSGYNSFARGVLDNPDRYADRETKYKFVVHAEANAVLTCARLGICALDSTIFTQGIPCKDCADAVIQGGISKIVVHKQWQNYEQEFNWSKWMESSKISAQKFLEVGISIHVLDEILGVKGYLDGKVIDI